MPRPRGCSGAAGRPRNTRAAHPRSLHGCARPVRLGRRQRSPPQSAISCRILQLFRRSEHGDHGTPVRGRSLVAVTASETPQDTGYLPVMLNPFEPGFFDDPYAQYKLVRESDPVHLSPIGAWALFRYADVHHVLRDPSLSVEERHMKPLAVRGRPRHPGDDRRTARGRHAHDAEPRPARPPPFAATGVEGVHPAHGRGAAPARAATRRRAPRRRRARAATNSISSPALAFPLPFIVISEMLGIPEGPRPLPAARMVGRGGQDLRSRSSRARSRSPRSTRSTTSSPTRTK